MYLSLKFFKRRSKCISCTTLQCVIASNKNDVRAMLESCMWYHVDENKDENNWLATCPDCVREMCNILFSSNSSVKEQGDGQAYASPYGGCNLVVERLLQLCKAVTSLLQGCIIVVAFYARWTQPCMMIVTRLLNSKTASHK